MVLLVGWLDDLKIGSDGWLNGETVGVGWLDGEMVGRWLVVLLNIMGG